MGLKENIKFFRTEQKLTLEELAKKVGLSRTTIQRYESGIITNIPQDNIEKLAEVFNVTPSQLIGWDEKSESYDNDMPKQKSLASLASLRFFTNYLEFTNQITDGNENAASYGQFIMYFKKYFNDIDIYSLEKYMSYLSETFQRLETKVDVDDIIELYKESTDFIEFKLKKILEKNKNI